MILKGGGFVFYIGGRGGEVGLWNTETLVKFVVALYCRGKLAPRFSPPFSFPLPRFPGVQFDSLSTDRCALLSERLEQAKFIDN